ncbi:MAG: VWA domain-containing protein [Alphaproteobacteria bacterium]|nr:VWA domain-containing protein [Alphaproteobacteria bacterium]
MKKTQLPATPSLKSEVGAFLATLKATPQAPAGRGRLLFAIDATASREPTWDLACQIQAEMFAAAELLGGIEIQLCFYRGFSECKATPWLGSAAELVRRMIGVRCQPGRTQIVKVLHRALAETRAQKVNALVFVGDVIEEDIDELDHLAGELGLLATPAFVFQEGGDPIARRTFETIARLSGGAYSPFDTGSAAQLKALLTAVAVFSAGGRAALENHARRAGGPALALTHQLGGRK